MEILKYIGFVIAWLMIGQLYSLIIVSDRLFYTMLFANIMSIILLVSEKLLKSKQNQE